jgi:hypothetical protein
MTKLPLNHGYSRSHFQIPHGPIRNATGIRKRWQPSVPASSAQPSHRWRLRSLLPATGRARLCRPLGRGLKPRLANHQSPAHTFVQTVILAKQKYTSVITPGQTSARATGYKHPAGATLGELLRSRALQNPNDTALSCNDRRMNYGELIGEISDHASSPSTTTPTQSYSALAPETHGSISEYPCDEG